MYYAFLIFAGMLQGLMLSLNAQLGYHFSMMGVTFFVHAIALVILLFHLLVIKREKLRFTGAPWYIYLVGFMGIGVVASSSYATLHTGAGTAMAISTLGQLISSEVIDAFGLFGMKKVLPDIKQLPGFLFVAAGVALVIIF